MALEKGKDHDIPMIILATAAAAKFPDAVRNACGVSPELPNRMSDLLERVERFKKVPNNLDQIKKIIIKGIDI